MTPATEALTPIALLTNFAASTQRSSSFELNINRVLTSRAESFAGDHVSDMPGVVFARERSVWGIGNQGFQLSLAVAEGRVRGFEQAGTILYWISLPFVIVGLVVLAKNSRRRLVILATPLVLVTLNSAIFYGSTRMRMAAEPSLAVLAALGVIAVIYFVRTSRHSQRVRA